METQTIVAISAIVLANIGTTIGLFTWATSHASNESKETKRILEAIQSEIKDFHGRLCIIEERNSNRILK